jgi:hypothetical protein
LHHRGTRRFLIPLSPGFDVFLASSKDPSFLANHRFCASCFRFFCIPDGDRLSSLTPLAGQVSNQILSAIRTSLPQGPPLLSLLGEVCYSPRRILIYKCTITIWVCWNCKKRRLQKSMGRMAGRPRKNIFWHLDHYLKCPAIVEKKVAVPKKKNAVSMLRVTSSGYPQPDCCPARTGRAFCENNRTTIPHFPDCEIMLENQMIINY